MKLKRNLNFKNGFLAGFLAALLVVTLQLSVWNYLKDASAGVRGHGTLTLREEIQPVSQGIPDRNERYALKDYDGTNAYAPLYSGLKRNPYSTEDITVKNGFRYYGKPEEGKSLVGIDVSRYQANVDWAKVRQAGVDYAILRIGYRGYGSEGKIVMDENFTAHADGATSVGMPFGVYFFSQAITKEEAVEEARAVVEALKGYQVTYPVVFDTEHIPNTSARANDLTVKELTQITKAFCQEIEKAGYEPMIYANERWFLLHMDLRKLKEYPLWLAAYKKELTFPYQVKMWQYTEKGTVDGIEGNVDLNVCFVD